MRTKLFGQPVQNVWIELFRYFFVGGAAFMVDFGLLYALTEYAHIHYTLSATLSFIAGLIVNYILSITWVFSNNKLNNRFGEFIIFGIIGVAGLGLNVLIIWSCTELLHFHYLVSKIISTIIVFVWNFTARKYILFNSKGSNGRTKSDYYRRGTGRAHGRIRTAETQRHKTCRH